MKGLALIKTYNDCERRQRQVPQERFWDHNRSLIYKTADKDSILRPNVPLPWRGKGPQETLLRLREQSILESHTPDDGMMGLGASTKMLGVLSLSQLRWWKYSKNEAYVYPRRCAKSTSRTEEHARSCFCKS